MICSKILISQNFGMGLGYKYKPFWTLRIPYRTWDVVTCLTWGKTTSKLHQDTVTSASACREVSGRLMMSGWRLSYQKKHMILRIQTGSYCRVEGSNPIRKVVGFDRTLIPFWKDISGFLGCESYFVPGFLLIKWSWNISIHLDTELPSHIKKWQGGYLKKHLWLVCLLRPIFMNGPMTYFHRKPPSPKEFAMPFWTNPTQPNQPQPNQPQPNQSKPPTFSWSFCFRNFFASGAGSGKSFGVVMKIPCSSPKANCMAFPATSARPKVAMASYFTVDMVAMATVVIPNKNTGGKHCSM